MALTLTQKTDGGGPRDLKIIGAPGDRVVSALFDVTFDNSYATGGEALDLSGYFESVVAVFPSCKLAGYTAVYDATNAKLQLWNLDTANEASGDHSATVVSILAFGIV